MHPFNVRVVRTIYSVMFLVIGSVGPASMSDYTEIGKKCETLIKNTIRSYNQIARCLYQNEFSNLPANATGVMIHISGHMYHAR